MPVADSITASMPPNAECLGCRYALVGVPECRCPECGRRFNPADPNSFGPSRGRRIGLIAARGPGLFTFIAAFVTLALCLVATSQPMANFSALMLVLLVGLNTAAASGIRLLLTPIGFQDWRDWIRAVWGGRLRWIGVPLVGVLCVLTLKLQPVWYLRLAASAPSLKALAKSAITAEQSGQPMPAGRMCGLIVVRSVNAEDGVATLGFDGGRFMDITSLVYSPNAQPVSQDRVSVSPLWLDDWYLISEGF